MKLITLLLCLALAPLCGQGSTATSIPCPGGQLLPVGATARTYHFVTDSVRLGVGDSGRPQLLVQHYENDDVSGTLLHLFLDIGPPVPARQLDSLVRSQRPGASYGGEMPYWLFSNSRQVPFLLLRQRDEKTDTLASENLAAGGRKLIYATRLEGKASVAFRSAQQAYPRERLVVSIRLPGAPGVPSREYLLDLTATIAARPQTVEE